MLLSFIDVLRWTALVAFASARAVWLFLRISHRLDGSIKVHAGH